MKQEYKDRGTELKQRTRQFALAVIQLYGRLPKTTAAQVIGKQVLRSGTSVGAHYHEATRARSSAEFVSKIDGGLQELEETIYWLLLLVEARICATKGGQASPPGSAGAQRNPHGFIQVCEAAQVAESGLDI